MKTFSLLEVENLNLLPVGPVGPTRPDEPAPVPGGPGGPVGPTEPLPGPGGPVGPVTPGSPGIPCGPIDPRSPFGPLSPIKGVNENWRSFEKDLFTCENTILCISKIHEKFSHETRNTNFICSPFVNEVLRLASWAILFCLEGTSASDWSFLVFSVTCGSI